jgi:hypothetical protein
MPEKTSPADMPYKDELDAIFKDLSIASLDTEEATLLAAMTSIFEKATTTEMVNDLCDSGFSLSHMAVIVGMYYPRLRDIRTAVVPELHSHISIVKLFAFCKILYNIYSISDPASWLETPILKNSHVAPEHLLARDCYDLVFILAKDPSFDREVTLKAFHSNEQVC